MTTSRKNSVSIRYKKSALKELEAIPRNYQAKIVEAIEALQCDPLAGKALVGEFSMLRRLRVGTYRIAYSFENDEVIILILKIGHRRDFYGELRRLLI